MAKATTRIQKIVPDIFQKKTPPQDYYASTMLLRFMANCDMAIDGGGKIMAWRVKDNAPNAMKAFIRV